MKVTDLQREIFTAERIAELGRAVLNADQRITALTAENEKLKGAVGELQGENERLKSEKALMEAPVVVAAAGEGREQVEGVEDDH